MFSLATCISDTVICESITDKTRGYSSEGSTIQKLDFRSSNTVLNPASYTIARFPL